MERRVLPHITEIGGQQHQPLCSVAAQRLGGEQQRNELVVWLIQRRIHRSHPPRQRHAHAQLHVGKSVNDDLINRHAKARGEPASVPDTRWQAVNREAAHGFPLAVASSPWIR
jgi:hypothetical protein